MGWDYFGILIECTVTLFSIRKVKRRNDNSGVFIRFSDPGADASNAFKTGYEIQIDDLALPDGKAEHKTGAVYDIVPHATLASKQVGEWNTFEFHAQGQNYTVIMKYR